MKPRLISALHWTVFVITGMLTGHGVWLGQEQEPGGDLPSRHS
jgi:hypothetical protein